MALSIRTSVVGAFCALVIGLCSVGLLAVTASIHSAQQAADFQQKSVVPVVELGTLSQNIDQERDLLGKDIAHMKPDRRRAVQDELKILDGGITNIATRVLSKSSLAQWRVAWSRYVSARVSFMYVLLYEPRKILSSSAREGLSNRLDSGLDIVQRRAGEYLYSGQRLYVSTVGDDWTRIRITVFGVGLMLLVGLLFATLIVQRLKRGLGNLESTARAITQGDLEVRADTAGRDELSVVARAFNHMTDALLQMERTALTDPLTGLGNHRAFHEEFDRELARAARHGHALSLALIDVDDFKPVNDTYGHSHGDRTLADLAACLRKTRVEDRHFRIGGDEFAILLPYVTGEEAKLVLERLRGMIETAMQGLTVSIGIADLEESVEDSGTLRERADAALYESKRTGRNRITLFDSIRGTAVIVSPAKIQAVRQLMADGRVAVAFQPIWALGPETILGYEALMRPPPETGLTNPQEVFDIAEKLGRAPELDQLCMSAVLGRAHELHADALLFINLSPQSLDYGALASDALLRMMQEVSIEPSRIVFEVTERSITRVEVVVREVKRLRALGFRLALDDVGAGNAGLEMLRQVNVDFVKIDRSVIAEALIDEGAAAVLSGIVAFARHAGTFVIAEGIETQAMLDIIYEMGVPDPATSGGVQGVQGYLFGRPNMEIADASTDPGFVIPYASPKGGHRTGGHAAQ